MDVQDYSLFTEDYSLYSASFNESVPVIYTKQGLAQIIFHLHFQIFQNCNISLFCNISKNLRKRKHLVLISYKASTNIINA